MFQLLTMSCSHPPEGGFAIAIMTQPELLVEAEDFVVNGMRFLPVSATTFQMGSPDSENGRQPHPESDPDVEIMEKVFTATLTRDFYLSETEVTLGLFQQYFEDDGAGFSNCNLDDCPAQFLNWHMAAGYTVYLSDEQGYEPCYSCEGTGRDVLCTTLFEGSSIHSCTGFRLPTEAEWELAARAGSPSAIWTPSGGAEIPQGVEFSCEPDQILSDGTPISDFAWYCSNTEHAQSVGQLSPNGFGFYDIRGNVWEWTHDGFWFYPEEATINPVGDPNNDRHSLRGGRWGNEPYALRSSKRIMPKADFWNGNFGFRLAIRAPNNFR